MNLNKFMMKFDQKTDRMCDARFKASAFSRECSGPGRWSQADGSLSNMAGEAIIPT